MSEPTRPEPDVPRVRGSDFEGFDSSCRARGRNGSFTPERARILGADDGSGHYVSLQVASRSAGNRAPIIITGPLRTIRQMLQHLIQEIDAIQGPNRELDTEHDTY